MSEQPLQGIRVVDLTRVLAGPYCTMVLRNLGAEIVKVEAPITGDDARHFEPFLDECGKKSAYFVSLNAGKKSVALDLRTNDGRRVLEDLIRQADVLIENFRPGTLESLGFSDTEIRALNPSIIFASISGFGQSGPDSQRPAYDITIQALSGLMSITGTEDGDCVKVGASISDIVTGLYTALGIAAALFRRERTREGARLDVAMLDSTVAVLENAFARYQASGRSPSPLGSRHSSITPFDSFRTSDSAIIIAAGNDKLFGSLCAALGKPQLAEDHRFAANSTRTQNAAALKEQITAALSEHGGEYWLRKLEERGIPCAKVRSVAEVFDDAQLKHRDMLVPVGEGEFKAVGNPIKFVGQGNPATLEAAPALGADSAAILREILGYSAERIAGLLASGVVQAES